LPKLELVFILIYLVLRTFKNLTLRRLPMKRKRTIRLKDPQLIKIRNNLRALIEAAGSARKREINNQKLKLMGGGPRAQKKYQRLSKEYDQLEIALRASICVCPSCFSSKKDMTFNPNTKMWYCTSCYKTMQKYNDVEMDGEIVNFP
jgi:ribosomal protein L37AE/L43A